MLATGGSEVAAMNLLLEAAYEVAGVSPPFGSGYRKHENPPPMGYVTAAAALGVTTQHFWQVWNGLRKSKRLMAAYAAKFNKGRAAR